jgi:hypothetical protein
VPEQLVRIIATVRQNYGGLWYSAGDIFHASRADADDLLALKYAALAPDEAEATAQAARYERRDMRARR